MPDVATLADAVVHGLDVRIPLGIHHNIELESFRLIADWTVTSRWPMTVPIGGNVRKRLRGTRLIATDAEWAWGEGVEVFEPSDRILLRLLCREPPSR